MRISSPELGLSIECEDLLCLLLRDNVQHFLEGGTPSARFTAIHALADCYWAAAPPSLTGRRLASELGDAWPLLRSVPSSKLAISIRSRAVTTGALSAPSTRGTVLLRLTGWKLPLRIAPQGTLHDLFGPTVARLSAFCEQVGQRRLTVEDYSAAMLRRA